MKPKKTVLDQLFDQIEVNNKEGQSLREAYERVLKTVSKDRLASLVGKCFVCVDKNDRGVTRTFYKVIKAEVNTHAADNENLECLIIQESPSYSGGIDYHFYKGDFFKSVIDEAPINPDLFAFMYNKYLVEAKAKYTNVFGPLERGLTKDKYLKLKKDLKNV